MILKHMHQGNSRDACTVCKQAYRSPVHDKDTSLYNRELGHVIEVKIDTTLDEVRAGTKKLGLLGLTTLAWLSHEAEGQEDDRMFIAIGNEVQGRGPLAFRIHAHEYVRIWPEWNTARRQAPIAGKK